MSWNVKTKGPARHAVAEFEREATKEAEKRNAFEQTVIKAAIPLVALAVKHSELTDYEAQIEASGHHDDEGTGQFQVKITIAKVTPVPERRTGPAVVGEE